MICVMRYRGNVYAQNCLKGCAKICVGYNSTAQGVVTFELAKERNRMPWQSQTLILTCVLTLLAIKPAYSLDKVIVDQRGRGFCLSDGRRFIPWGVNYFRPGTGWAPQLWKKFDVNETRNDFRRMQQLGINCVRVFLTYGSFFSEPDRLDETGLAKFDQFLEIAEEFKIYVHPTGPDHWEGLPPFARRDRIASREALEAVCRFWTLFAARYQGRSVIFAYDLLNEPSVPWESPSLVAEWNRWLAARYGSLDNLSRAWSVPAESIAWGQVSAPDATRPSPQLLDYQLFREEIADTWTSRQVEAIKTVDPEALVTVGFIQWSVPVLLPGPRSYSAFRPQRQARFLDFLEVHFYPLALGFYEYRDTKDELANLAYLHAVVGEVAKAGKPVVLAEFGWYGGGRLTINEGRHPSATEEQQARWCRRAVEVSRPYVQGWLNWGLYDHPEAQDVTQLTGLLRVDGTPKAWGQVFSELGKSWSQGESFSEKPLPDSLPKLDWNRAVVDMEYARSYREKYSAAVGLQIERPQPPAGPFPERDN
ncbi:MAG: beta-galactosidase [Thermogutta sp.]